MMKQYGFAISPYNTNTDLYILSLLFLAKRMTWKISSGPRNGGPMLKDYTYLIYPLLVKLYVDVDFEDFILLLSPLVVYVFMVRSMKNERYESYEVMQIVKTWTYHSIEMVWFWVFLPLAIWGGPELFTNPMNTIMTSLCIFSNSFWLLSTHILEKRFYELKFQAHHLGYWKKITEKEAYSLRSIKPNSNSNKGAIIEYNGSFYKGMCESNKIISHIKHNGKPGDMASYLLYFLFYTPERTYLILLLFHSIICLCLIAYAAWRTQYLYPTINCGLSVIVLINMCSKRILIR